MSPPFASLPNAPFTILFTSLFWVIFASLANAILDTFFHKTRVDLWPRRQQVILGFLMCFKSSKLHSDIKEP